MSHIKIVTDSSANLSTLTDVDFAYAPLKINTSECDFCDDDALDMDAFLSFMEQYKGRSQTSCPNTSDWLAAFGDAETVICLTISGNMSGSFNAARSAAQIYEAEHAGRHVLVLDSLTAGPEMLLLIDRLRANILAGMTPEAIAADMEAYRKTTGLVCMLQSLHNFASNGRVSPSVAKLAGFVGLCIVARASDEGTLEPTDKCRGEARSLVKLVENMRAAGLVAGQVRIAHCQNASGAEALKALLQKEMPAATVEISELRGLCSYYAETGGILVGFEKC